MKIQVFTFNEFQEQTMVVSGEDGTCVIIDPGCHRPDEVALMSDYIDASGLRPTHVYLTHAHIDHILGLKYCTERFDIGFNMHRDEDPILTHTPQVASLYGMPYQPAKVSPSYIEDDAVIRMGGMDWRTILAPGHSPGSLCYYQEETHQLIGGDVLFHGSIGRTDLPGGDHATLIHSIKSRLLCLPDETIVYPGHGAQTTIGYEREQNPFLA